MCAVRASTQQVNHFTQGPDDPNMACKGVDLWKADGDGTHSYEGPAYDRNGTYNEFIFRDQIRHVIRAHDEARPLFMYVATSAMHVPRQAPQSFMDLYAESDGFSERFAASNAMATVADELLGATVAALKSRDFWANTLLVRYIQRATHTQSTRLPAWCTRRARCTHG